MLDNQKGNALNDLIGRVYLWCIAFSFKLSSEISATRSRVIMFVNKRMSDHYSFVL